MGWRDITHCPVSSAKGENRMSHLFFLFCLLAKATHNRPLSNCLPANLC